MLDLFDLPGPRAFAEKAATNLGSGRNSIIYTPSRFCEGLFHSIEARVGETHTWREGIQELDTATSPLDSLEALYLPGIFEARKATVSDIAGCNAIRGVIHCIHPASDEVSSAWIKFLAIYDDACRAQPQYDRPLFCLDARRSNLTPNAKESICLGIHEWRSIISPNDQRFFAESVDDFHVERGVLRRLVIETAVQLSCWDIQLCWKLLIRGIDLALDPMRMLAEVSGDAGKTEINENCQFAEGLIEEFEERICRHISIDFPADRQEVCMRIWRAQLVILMPFLEEERIRIVDEIGLKCLISGQMECLLKTP
jgi:hypothetical protein